MKNLGLLALVFLSGCSCYNPKDTAGNNPTLFEGGGSAPSYALIQAQVFTPKCLACHSTGDQSPALDNYSSVKANLSDIEEMAISKEAMPPKKPLPGNLSSLLASWIAAGAPLNGIQPSPSPSASAEPSPNPTTTIIPSNPTYATVQAQLFLPKCLRCHSPGDHKPALDTYAAVKANLDDVETMVITKRKMPPKHPLSDELIALLSEWIKDGAPEGDPAPIPSATPAPSPTVVIPLAPTFTSIQANILEPKCVSCHSASGIASDYPLESRQDVLAFVVAGNPAQSKIYSEVSLKKMPPQSSGKTLSDQEIQTISEWISQGAPQ